MSEHVVHAMHVQHAHSMTTSKSNFSAEHLMNFIVLLLYFGYCNIL